MKKSRLKWVLTPIVIAALYFGLRELKSPIVDWYVDHYHIRNTSHVASENPEQICLTWPGDPRNTIAVQWRTATSVPDGALQFREKAAEESATASVKVAPKVFEDKLLSNDKLNHRYTAVLRDLKPATSYVYRVGSSQKSLWSEWTEFTTAPDGAPPFSFIYLGDPQEGLNDWGKLLDKAYEHRPDAAFYVIAGDLVDRGKFRNDWDEFFAASAGLFDRRPVVPSLGNHDYAKEFDPRMYHEIFALPENGPDTIPKERAYTLRYSNAEFFVLDSNLDPASQAPWLEEQLAKSTATWKFLVFHHPAYSSKKNRENPEVLEIWGALCDKYKVDMALQGHDHAYLRTPPMRDGSAAAAGETGTIYVVSVSGTKYYEQEQHDYAAVAFPNVSTYQVLDIATEPRDSLTYRAYDIEGKVRDEFVLTK